MEDKKSECFFAGVEVVVIIVIKIIILKVFHLRTALLCVSAHADLVQVSSRASG